MSTIEVSRALAAVCRTLQQQGRDIALVGGLAVSMRAEARFTRDVDVVIAVVDDADADAITHPERCSTIPSARRAERRERVLDRGGCAG